jgi:hypothetical protein
LPRALCEDRDTALNNIAGNCKKTPCLTSEDAAWKKIKRFRSSVALLQLFTTVAQQLNQGSRNRPYIDFGLLFFAPFFWRSKRKESKTTQTKKNSISVGETKERKGNPYHFARLALRRNLFKANRKFHKRKEKDSEVQ